MSPKKASRTRQEAKSENLEEIARVFQIAAGFVREGKLHAAQDAAFRALERLMEVSRPTRGFAPPRARAGPRPAGGGRRDRVT